MALLDMSRDIYKEIYVAHVNYHHRETAKRDEDIVKDYCDKYNIKFFKEDYVDTKGGNFQNKARIFRYKFFAELIDEYNLDCVLIAHNEDDLIETFYMQLDKKLDVDYYGLRNQTVLYGAKVVRPLLAVSKQELEKYCIEHNVPYGIDESNLTDDYTRNKIRHSRVCKLSPKERLETIENINKINENNQKIKENIKLALNEKTKIKLKDYKGIINRIEGLRIFIGINISRKHAEEILRMLEETESFEIKIRNKYLCKEYGYLEVYPIEKDYSYTLDNIKYIKKKHFKLSKKGNSKQGVTLNEDDFPITIRNYKEGDSILMRYGTKKINRFFIDNKISSRQRKMWPIMFNSYGDVVLVPEIGCNKDHFSTKHSVYMIEF